MERVGVWSVCQISSPCILPTSVVEAKWRASPIHLLQTLTLERCKPAAWQHRYSIAGVHRSKSHKKFNYAHVRKFAIASKKLSRSRNLIRNVYELEPDDSGKCKDDSDLYKRTIYDREAWLHHTNSLRHAKTILSMARSKVVIALAPPVSVLTFISMSLTLYNEMKLLHWLPSWFPLLHMNPLPFQLLAPALPLLLVFRTNASYGRFDEARKAWGSNVSRTRDIARQALCYVQHPSDRERLKKFLRHCIAYCYCMKNHMLKEGDVKKDLTYLLEENELEDLLNAPHQPNFCLMMLSEIIHNCNISDGEQALMSHNITQFFDNLGTCERIFKTPIPLSYTRLTSRLLVIWHVILPLALWDQCKWAVVPATTLSAAVLFCIEEVGVLIEEPFQIFPLEILCSTASKNVDNLVQVHTNYIHGCSERREYEEGDQEILEGKA